MLNLFRRPSGIYVLRIAVPAHLRPVLGKREVVTSTGSSELTIAKIVAGAQQRPPAFAYLKPPL